MKRRILMKKFTGYGLVTGACLFVSGALVFQSPHSSHAANGSAIAAVSGTAGTNIANSSTRLFSDSGAGSVRLEALRNATNLGGDVNFRLSGYLVDVQ